MNVKENYQQIRSNIEEICQRCGRNPDDIHIIAVTKYVSVDRANAALEAGVIHIGENRDEGLNMKHEELGEKATWHFIGSLQTRKVKQIIEKVDYIHSLDRLSLAIEINKRATKPIKCFIQVNVSGEESKHGISPGQVAQFVDELKQFEFIEIVGLMTMAPFTEDTKIIRTCFRKLKELQLEIQALSQLNAPCNELSMGMSNDYKIAIEEGATFIRIGTALVGNESRGV
ncbi:YggS family pyridoxal phosphate-dependent enzyme [Metabacillus malikii]|uniref:Pyridoxal phosphate homeostasis protein n=1 Tax=Metabacillus malikii TaxID=1504265 RepID=A0ABT9ZG63_9BACI|nr:YggS family pyridoxal phosphate-dependent enzyme [Metabacillus malikii]MDQ0231256.1 pyridoxal phosphate enzyme (YggS family) [Metabacillus malikii]